MAAVDPRSYSANDLRKSGQYQEALNIYQELWNSGKQDEFIGAGMLHCYRKLHKLGDAVKFSETLSS